MSSFNSNFFRDNSVIRAICAGVVQEFNNAVNIIYDKDHKVEMPCYFSLGVEESFLYDHFLRNFTNDEKAQTQYDKVPRMIINYESDTIQTENVSNPYSRIRYNKEIEVDGEPQIKPYNAKVRSIPIIINFNCEILVSSLNEMLIINEELLKTFYKNKTFVVDTKICPIPGVIRLPETLEKDRLLEKTFQEKNNPKITFSFEVLSFIPDVRTRSERFVGKKMQQGINVNITDLKTKQEYIKLKVEDIKDSDILNIPDDVTFHSFDD